MRAISFAATDTAFHGYQRLCEALLSLVGANIERRRDRRTSSVSQARKIAWYTPEMTTNSLPCGALSDRDLIAAVHDLAAAERGTTSQLVASLAELDARRLYLAEGYSSLFTYCTQVLHLSEHAAYGRIEAARAARRYPVLLERLAAGGFTGTRGRCTERGFLEFHHVVPFADGGSATVENIQLRCRAHNQYESELWFGAGDPTIVRERPESTDCFTTRSGPS